MPQIDDPFAASDRALKKIREETHIIFVDFHAAAIAEKMAYAWYVDGTVSAVVGRHTNVPTNDGRIFSQGTGYMTDSRMTGAFDSLNGMTTRTYTNSFTLSTCQ